MGICETNVTHTNIIKHKKMRQPFNAKIREIKHFDNNISLNTLSQTDIMNFRFNKPSKNTPLYKYKSKYGKKEEQTTLLSETLYNSFDKNKKNSMDITNIEENLNESSSQVFEIISDGKMDKDKLKLSSDKTTIDNYLEYIDNGDDDLKNSKVDINNVYNSKKTDKKNY